MAKKQKQIPVKQQMYEQILTKQLYGDPKDNIAKIQADYESWKARQDDIAKIQADYEAWSKAQQQPVEAQPIETPQIEKPVQKTVRNTPAVEVKVPEEKKKYLTHADVLPTLTKRSADVTQNPEMARLGQGGGVDLFNRPKVATSFVKKAGWDDVGEGQATVYSSTYSNAKGNKAANFTPIVADSQGNYIKTLSQEELEKYAEDVINGRRKDDLKLQIGKVKQGEKAIDDAVKDAERIHQLQEDYYIEQPKRQKEELKKKNEATSIKRIAAQLNISEAEVKARMQEPKNEAFVSPDSVKIDKDTTKQVQEALAEDSRKKAQKKYGIWDAFTGRMAKASKDVVNAPVAIAGKIAGKDWSLYSDAQKQEMKDIKEQHPVASGAGDLAGMAFAALSLGGGLGGAASNAVNSGQVLNALRDEAIMNGATKGAATLQALKGALPVLAANTANAMPIDLATDIIPTLANDIAEGEKTDAEIVRDTLLNTGINAGFDAIGDIASIVNAVRKSGNAVNADNAFAGNIREGAEKLSALNAEDAAKQIDVPNVPEIEAPKVEVPKIETPKTPSQASLPQETFDKIDSYFEELARPMNEVQNSGLMKTVTDEKALKEWDNLNAAYSDYLNKSMFSDNVEEITAAKKTLDNTRKRYARAMKNIDPEVSAAFNSGSYGYRIGRPLNARNTMTPTEEQADEAFDLIRELEESNKPQSIDNVPQNKVIAAEMEGYKSDVPSSRAAEPIEESWELKERGQSKHIRGEGKMQMEGVSDEVVADFQDEPQLYAALKNSETKAKAENVYNTSNNPEVDFRDMLRNHDPAALPLGHQLAKDYSAAGNHEAAAQIYREMGEQLTKAGQFSQAAAINMMKNDPLTALQYAQRQLDTLNQQGAKRFGKRWKDFKLTDDEIKMFDDIAPGDEEAIKEAFDTIGVRLGKEYPTTFMDKLLEGRKIAMLFNLRTNVRNAGANVPTLGMRWASDRFEALGQNAAHLINPDFKVTQSITGSGVQGRKIATQVYNSPKLKAMIEGTNGKYEIPELKNSLVKNKQMYKGTIAEKWLDRVTGNAFNKIAKLLKKDVRIDGGIQAVNKKLYGKEGVESALETIRNTTYKLLDLGDSPFVRENFIERLGSYIHAQGIKSVDDVPEEAIATAWEEAMKATYKDDSWAVKMLSGIKSGAEKIPVVGRPISQAAIPFLQAPGNIAARMVDYSPIRGTKGIADIIRGANSADENLIRKGIEEASKGLTGSLMILLGMKLRQAGLITGTYSKDKDQKAFEKQNGFKEFALHVKDKYFTYDWAQPFAQSMIVGTLLQDAIEKSDEYDSDLLAYIDSKAGTNFNDSFASKALGVAGEGAKASLNSWFNASPLQGLSSLLSGNYTDKDDIASSVKQTLVDDFLGAFVPATVNATAKSIDPVQRNTTDKTSATATFVNQQIAKLPGLSKMLPAKYDTWGNEMKYADSKEMAAASRFLIPGEYSYDKTDSIDKEINRLYEATGNAAVFPPVSPNNVGDKKLNNKETSIHQKDMGERSRALVEEFIKSDSYKNMDDADIAEVIPKLYGVSKAITDRDKFGKEPAQNSEYNKPIAEYDNAGGGEKGVKALVDYYNAKETADKTGFNSNSNASKAIQEDIKNGNVEAAEKKVDDATKIVSMGLDKPGPTYTYYNAQKQIPGLTPETFVETYKGIDVNGNQGIAQDEIIDYLNRNHLSESEGKKIWNAYGNSNWKSIPSLNDGKWSKQKKK